MSSRETAAHERLTARRREAESRLADLRRAIDRELGAWAPKKALWVLPLVAFAGGVVLALMARRGQRSAAEAAQVSDRSDRSDVSD